MSWAIEEMLNIVWCLAALGADVEANILNDSALVGAKESTMSGSELGEGRAFLQRVVSHRATNINKPIRRMTDRYT